MSRIWLPTSHDDPQNFWTNESNGYDGNTSTYTESDTITQFEQTDWIEFYRSSVTCNKIRFRSSTDDSSSIYYTVEMYDGTSWITIMTTWGDSNAGYAAWSSQTFNLMDASGVRIKFYTSATGGQAARIHEVRFVLQDEVARFDNVTIQKYEDKLYFKELSDTPQFTLTQSDILDFKKLINSRDYIKNEVLLTGKPGWCGEYSGPSVDLNNKKRGDRRYYMTFKPELDRISRIRMPISGAISTDYKNDTVYFKWGGILHRCGYMITQSGNKLDSTIINSGSFTNAEDSRKGRFFKPATGSGTYVTVPLNGTEQIDYGWSGNQDIEFIHTNIYVSSNHSNGKLQATWRFYDNYGNFQNFSKNWQQSGNNNYLIFDDIVDYTGVSSASLVLADSDGGGTHYCSFDCAGLFAEGFDDSKYYNTNSSGNLPILHYPIGIESISKECRGWEEIPHYRAYLSGSEEGLFQFPDNPNVDTDKWYIFEWMVTESSGVDKDGYVYDGFTNNSGNVLIYYLSSKSSNTDGNYRLYYSESPQEYRADNIGTSGCNWDGTHKHCHGLAMQIGYGSDRMRIHKKNSSSISKYGTQRYTKSYPHMDYRNLNLLADKLTEKYASSNWSGILTIKGKPEIELGQKFNLYLDNFDISGTYEVGAYSHKIGGKRGEGFVTDIELSTPKYDINEDINEIYSKERL